MSRPLIPDNDDRMGRVIVDTEDIPLGQMALNN